MEGQGADVENPLHGEAIRERTIFHERLRDTFGELCLFQKKKLLLANSYSLSLALSLPLFLFVLIFFVLFLVNLSLEE